MSDKFDKATRSRIMTSIRQKNTKIELSVFKELRKRRLYFQKHYRRVIGSPDIAIPSKKVAVFLDGDFWHGYRYVQWKKRLGSQYWNKKIEKNMKRDRRTFRKLKKSGWKVKRFWEHQIQSNLQMTVDQIERLIQSSRKK